jgi:hypothetical protein
MDDLLARLKVERRWAIAFFVLAAGLILAMQVVVAPRILPPDPAAIVLVPSIPGEQP